jgi:hypothetical protein
VNIDGDIQLNHVNTVTYEAGFVQIKYQVGNDFINGLIND